MQPFRYITDVASTYTFKPSMSKTLSIMPEPFSNCMEYEKPEQPPPTTPTRRPAGTGFCCAMISFTLLTALAVRLMGAFFVSAGFTSGVVVVAICISLKGLTIIIAKATSSAACEIQSRHDYRVTGVCQQVR